MNTTLPIREDANHDKITDGAASTGNAMADKENAAEQEEKQQNKPMLTDNPESVQPDDKEPLDDSKTQFINGGSSLDDTKVEITRDSASDASFTGLGKEELKNYEKDPFWVRLRWVLFILFWVGWVSMLESAIAIILLAPRCPHRPDLKWYHKDVHYNIYAKSFFDGGKTQDGYGDLEGIKKKAGYVNSMVANTFWLSSIVKTDGNNDRAVLDHTALDEKFGTLASLKAFCRKLTKEGKQVIMDFIPNQTSRNHTWFTKSQKRERKYANYYVWADRVAGLSPNNWEREDRSGKMWVWDQERRQYYLSQFDGTADLNLTNKDVLEEFKKIMHFWAGQGISGFHVNDLEYLTENTDHTASNIGAVDTKHYEDNAKVVDALRGIVDGMENKPGREKLLMGTVSVTNSDQLGMYGGQEGKRGLHIVAVKLDDLTRDVTAQDLQAQLEPYINGSNYWIGWRLTSARPGSERVFNRVGDERMTIAHALQALLPGSALPYYGDEIAMENGIQRQKRTVTPMQWSKAPNAGFTEGIPWLSVDDYRDKNVDSNTAQLRYNRMMEAFKSLNELRTNESLQFGETLLCSTDNLLIFARHAEEFDSFVVVANLGPATGHNFGSSECIRDKKTAKLVFHSHENKHENSELKMDKAVDIAENEVLVFRLSP